MRDEDEIDEWEIMYQHEDEIRSMTEDERRKIYEDWIQTLDEDERRKVIEEDQLWEKSKPEMRKKIENGVYLGTYSLMLKKGCDLPPKELAEAVNRRHPDIEVPGIIVNHLCKSIIGGVRQKGRPRRLLNDPVKATRDIKLFENFQQLRADGISASECYVQLGKIHDISMERARNIITEKNNRKKQDAQLMAQLEKSYK